MELTRTKPTPQIFTYKQMAKPGQFKAGTSGNPGGRPKIKQFREALRIALNRPHGNGKNAPKKLAAIAEKLVEEAIQGAGWAHTLIRDTIDGKPPLAIVGDDEYDPVRTERNVNMTTLLEGLDAIEREVIRKLVQRKLETDANGPGEISKRSRTDLN